MIDIFYMWGQSWAQKYHDGNQAYAYILIATAAILYIGAIVFNIFNFIWFSGCGFNTFINVLNVVIMIAITIV